MTFITPCHPVPPPHMQPGKIAWYVKMLATQENVHEFRSPEPTSKVRLGSIRLVTPVLMLLSSRSQGFACKLVESWQQVPGVVSDIVSSKYSREDNEEYTPIFTSGLHCHPPEWAHVLLVVILIFTLWWAHCPAPKSWYSSLWMSNLCLACC